jgi:hypothetical protein
MDKWRADGVQYIKNARTNQMMPLEITVLMIWKPIKKKYSLMRVKAPNPYLIIQGT